MRRINWLHTITLLLIIFISNKTYSQDLPDFTVDITTLPFEIIEGSTPTITIKTENIGTSYASAGVVNFYLSENSSYDVSDTYIGNQYCYITLAAGESYTYDVTHVSIPSGTSLGLRYLIAYIDGGLSVNESNENNNTDSRLFEVVENTLLPELSLSIYSASPSTINVGENTTLVFNLSNTGDADAGSNTTEFYLSSNTTCENYIDEYLGSYTYTSINAGGNSTTGTTVTIPTNVDAGTWYIVAKVDANNEVTESNEENNNIAYKQVEITADRDLLAEIISLNPSSILPGESTSLNFILSNLGSDNASSSTMKFYISSNSTFESASDIYLSSYNCYGLTGGGTSTANINLTIPGTLYTGTWYILCIADAISEITETNENNNIASHEISILPKPDLFIVSAKANPSYIFDGESTSLTFTTIGSQNNAGPSRTKFYLSSNTTYDSGSDILLGYYDLSSIYAGDVIISTKNLTIPSGTGTGITYILCTTDANNEVDESSETNNVYSVQVNINQVPAPTISAAPDCSTGSITIHSGLSGQQSYVLSTGTSCNTVINSSYVDASSYTFTNLPTGTYTAFVGKNGIYSSCSEPIELSNYEKPTVTIEKNDNDITISSDLTILQTFYLSDDNCNTYIDSHTDDDQAYTFLNLPDGTYSAYILNVYKGCISECSNNVTVVNKPDLYITDQSVDSKYIKAGESCSLTFTLGNASSLGTAGASTTKFYLSLDTQFDSDNDILLAYHDFGSLLPQETYTITKTITPTSSDDGVYYILSIADADNEIEEGQETNNSANTEIYIIQESPDPIISTPNSVKTEIPLVPAASDNTYELSQTDIQYFNGLGRPIQSINIKQSPSGKDIVQDIEYDELGRQYKLYLPYVIEGAGEYKYDPNLNNLTNFYFDQPNVAKTIYPYSETVFDNSPLNRVQEQIAVGNVGDIIQYQDFSVNFNYDVFVFNPEGGGGSVTISIVNNVLNISFSSGFAESPLKIGKIVELTTSPKLPDMILGSLADGRYQAYIDDGYLAIRGDFTPLENLTESLTIPLEGRSNPVKYNYLVNSTNEVSLWKVNQDNSCEVSNYYESNKLFKSETIDENENSVFEYVDLTGKTVLKKTNDGVVDLLTYYVYDIYDQLRYVFPPLAVENLGSETVFDTSHVLVKNLCYYYEYDHRNRMTIKKLPGADPIYMIYDNRDRLVLTQDGNLRDENNWIFTKYDEYNRPVLTGIYFNNVNTGQANMQAFVNSEMSVFYEEIPDGSDYEGDDFGYTNLSFPTSDFEILTVAYYDNYNFDINDVIRNYSETYDDIYDYPVSNINYETKGLVTGTLTKVLGTTDHYLMSVNFYDEKNRILRTYNENYLGGDDLILNSYNFIGNIIKTKQVHIKDVTTSPIVINQQFDYDHASRLEKVLHQIEGNGDALVMAEMEYNEIGQLIKKKLHESAPDNFLQEIDFTYNSRGWLTKINDTENTTDNLFAMQLIYNDFVDGITSTNEAQYNGNISAILWRTIQDKKNISIEDETVDSEIISNYMITVSPGTTLLSGTHLVIEPGAVVEGNAGVTEKQAYAFNYDDVNRLKKGDYKIDIEGWTNPDTYDLEAVNYDANGNISLLKRFGDDGSYLDNLEYDYLHEGNFTNQLRNVTDIGDVDNGFYDQTNAGVDEEYLYDNNGNLIVDDNKSFDVYYNYLNLPEEIDFGNGDKIKYIYDASGVKLAKETYQNNVLSMDVVYTGNIIYEDPTGSDFTLLTSEGKVSKTNSTYNYEYYLKDHLGNTRVMFHDDGSGNVLVDQVNSYYPFGMLFEKQNLDKNKYLYNGKELQEDVFNGVALDLYDYGMRMYDPSLGRFFTQDRFSEKYIDFSPYQYAANNPALFIDVNGDSLWINHKGNDILYENGSLYNKDGSAYTGKGVKTKKDGTVKYTGFLGKTMSALGAISGGADGASMISDLQSSDNNFVIQNASKSEFKANNASKAYAGQIQSDPNLSSALASGADFSGGSGGTIFWNSSGTIVPTLAGGASNGAMDLAHEMFHGLDANKGLLDNRMHQGIKRSEWSAVYQENNLRGQLGLSLRTHYVKNVDPSGVYIGGSGARMITPANTPYLPMYPMSPKPIRITP
ncbi:MAG TPA: hypothetical protein DCG75_04555 [Bacteroidales bacterium]|nr:hypothetical protein [Bacteroidales bacterium]